MEWLNILVVGGRGQIASYIFEHANESGHQVILATSNIQAAQLNPNLIHLDLNQTRSIDRALMCEPDAVVMLAGRVSPSNLFDNPVATCVENCVGFTSLLDRCTLHGVKKVFFASSREIYAATESDLRLRAVQLPRARNAYGASKIYGNAILEAYAFEFGIQNLTGVFFNHDSPRRQGNSFALEVARAARDVSLGKARSVIIDHDFWRDWSHASDGARACLALLESFETGVILIGSGIYRRASDYVHECLNYFGVEQDCLEIRRSEMVWLPCPDVAKLEAIRGGVEYSSLEAIAHDICKGIENE